VNGFIEEHVDFIVHAVHRVMHNTMEGKQGTAAEHLGGMLLRVLLQAVVAWTVLEPREFHVDLLELRATAVIRPEFLRGEHMLACCELI